MFSSLFWTETKMQTIRGTYFIHHPVSIFNGSLDDLLDSLRIVFISMDFETLQHSKWHWLVNTTVGKIKTVFKISEKYLLQINCWSEKVKQHIVIPGHPHSVTNLVIWDFMLSILFLSYINNKKPREFQFRTIEIVWYVKIRKTQDIRYDQRHEITSIWSMEYEQSDEIYQDGGSINDWQGTSRFHHKRCAYGVSNDCSHSWLTRELEMKAKKNRFHIQNKQKEMVLHTLPL